MNPIAPPIESEAVALQAPAKFAADANGKRWNAIRTKSTITERSTFAA